MNPFHTALQAQIEMLRQLELLALEHAHDTPDATSTVEESRQLLQRLAVRERTGKLKPSSAT